MAERDCNTCRHHRQAVPLSSICRACIEVTHDTFGPLTRLPYYEPNESMDAPAAFLELDPTHKKEPGLVMSCCYQGVVGCTTTHPHRHAWSSPISPAGVGRKDTNPKDAVGVKKAPLSTVPMNVVAEAGVAMLEGALKYGRHNYREAGIRESVYFDGTMRHLIAYWEGEDIDPDSGVSHLTKAIASLLVWRDAQMNGRALDDRPPPSAPFYAALNTRAAGLVEDAQAKGLKPKHVTAKESA